MQELILPPTGPRPTEPQRKFKTRAYAKKLLQAVLGPAPQWSWTNGRYVRKDEAGVPLKRFIENIMAEAKSMDLDLDRVVVRRASQNNSIAIEQRIFTESEEAYLKRYEEYERDLANHQRWDSLPPEEKKRVQQEIKRLKKLEDLQKKKNKLKEELNELSNEIERTASHA